MVNAWAVKNRLVLGQFHCEGGLDEITIIPELLRVLALKGCIVTVDAIGCHKSVAEQVIDRQGDYVLAVKANQPKLLDHVRQIFDREERQLHRDLSVDTFDTVLLFQCPDIRFPPTDFSPGGLCGFIILIELKKAKIVSLNRRGGCTLRR
jgi:predicted transposase YbfD/YdcC